MSKPQKSIAHMFKEGSTPLIRVVNEETLEETLYQVQSGEKPVDIEAKLRILCSPKGFFKILNEDTSIDGSK